MDNNLIYILLLRGINVSGQKKVPMAQLRQLLEDAGYSEVQTYIQSGNIILKTKEQNKPKIKRKVEELIENYFGFEVPVLVKTPEEIKVILNKFPFEQEKLESSYFTLLHSIPKHEIIETTSQLKFEKEEFYIGKTCVYSYSETGYGKAKANNNFFERRLKVSATTRNYKTMLKLLTLSS